MKLNKIITTGTLSAMSLAFFVSNSSPVSAAMKGLTDTNSIAFKDSPTKITSVPGGIGMLLGIVLSFLGVAFFLIIVYAGFKWMFARDNASEVAKAKDMITSAVIGLIIVLSAYAITSFLGGQLASK